MKEEETTKKRVHDQAIHLFKAGIPQDPYIQDIGQVQQPIPILDSNGVIVGWFVAITAEDKLVGFIQFHADLTFLRYSNFQRQPATFNGCPPSKIWLDTKTIIEIAKTKAEPDDTLAPPYLTFDKNISRIVWAVTATNPKGKTKTIYVAGQYSYLANHTNETIG